MKYILTLLELTYLYYMFFIFKTKYSIHHPFEILFQDIPYARHPIQTGKYENKICDLGRYFFYIFLPFVIIKEYLPKMLYKRITLLMISLILSIAFLLNLNAFIYLIPIMIIELIKIYL